MRNVVFVLLLAPMSLAGELVDLDEAAAVLKDRFNAGKERVRFVAVVSPT